MRFIALFLTGLVFASLALANSSGRIISAHGVRVVVPPAWQRIRAASDGNVVDPHTSETSKSRPTSTTMSCGLKARWINS